MSQNGQISEQSEDQSCQKLTCSPEGFHAKTSALQEKAQELTENEAGFGKNTYGSFANYDPATSLWRTSQRCLVEGWERFSETWPRAGMMRNGIVFRRQSSVRHMRGCGFGLWPTPTARMWKGASPKRKSTGSRLEQYLYIHCGGDGRNYYPHPACAEVMMGLPIGWTELNCSETARSFRLSSGSGKESCNMKA